MTQVDQVRRMLEHGWVCGTEFLDEHMPRYGARIHQLSQTGVIVARRQCQRHRHQSRQFEWRITADFSADGQGQMRVAG